jgi:hypothetical protein
LRNAIIKGQWMLIPKEQPHLARLNSYYLHFEKFIEHLQGEIGSGCLYCQAVDKEILVYFDGQEIIRAVTQTSGQHAQVSHDLQSVLQILSEENFLITVYYLHSASIFYWGELPSFRRNKTKIDKSKVTLPALATRFQERKFSGFIEIKMENRNDGAILFFHEGERRGGSYSWGKGGLSPSDEDYNRLILSVASADTATFALGQFIEEVVSSPEPVVEKSSETLDEELFLSDLETGIKEFLNIYMLLVKKKIKTDPIIQLKQKFLDSINEFPLLDLFKHHFQLNNDGTIEFATDVERKEITIGIVTCTWKVIKENKLEKKFRNAVTKWDYRVALEERGIAVLN